MKTLCKSFSTTMLFMILVVMLSAQTTHSPDYDFMVNNIEYQPGKTIDINVNLYVNEDATTSDQKSRILAIHGMAHTANTWHLLSEEFFNNSPYGYNISEFYAIDAAGRGGSSFPTNGVFGMMLCDDYVTIILAVLDQLNEQNKLPGIIIGHSMGGILVQMTQQRLVDQGTSLWDKYRIKKAILLGSSIPDGLEWNAVTSGHSAAKLLPFFQPATPNGPVLNLTPTHTNPNAPPYVWPYFFFHNLVGAPVSSRYPNHFDIDEYSALESGMAIFQLAGSLIGGFTHRPYIDKGLFKRNKGTELSVFGFDNDVHVSEIEEIELYKFLTCDKNLRRSYSIYGDDAIHDIHISDPFAIVELLDGNNGQKSGIPTPVENHEIALEVYPNPAEDMATITLELNETAYTTVSVYNAMGQQIAIIHDGQLESGTQTLTWQLSDLKVGIYFIKLQAGKTIITRKVLKQ